MAKKVVQAEPMNWADAAYLVIRFYGSIIDAVGGWIEETCTYLGVQSRAIDDRRRFHREAASAIESITHEQP